MSIHLSSMVLRKMISKVFIAKINSRGCNKGAIFFSNYVAIHSSVVSNLAKKLKKKDIYFPQFVVSKKLIIRDIDEILEKQ